MEGRGGGGGGKINKEIYKEGGSKSFAEIFSPSYPFHIRKFPAIVIPLPDSGGERERHVID
jgi:hypothetical protein